MKKKIICLMIILIFLLSINIYAKIEENINLKGETHIGIPVLEVENDDKVIVNFEDNNVQDEFNFIIKNYNKEFINQVEYFYQIEVIGLDDEIQFSIEDEEENLLEINDFKTQYFKMDYEKKDIKYKLKIDYNNLDENKNYDINLKINVDCKGE